MKVKQLFQYISYLQYPLSLIAIVFVFKPYIYGFDTLLKEFNTALIFMGLSISFSTLQDTQKTQNNFSKKIWENPKKGKRVLIFFSVFTVLVIVGGLIQYFSITNSKLKELSLGLMVLGISLIGMLKTAIEVFENHRKDKNPTNESLK